MNNLGKSNVFLSGMGGLGLEIAKCVALAGSRSLIIHDNLNVSLLDLSTQYYLNENQIGQNRATACVDKLRELNPYGIII
jgi:ubiquitin-activating enzyme E1